MNITKAFVLSRSHNAIGIFTGYLTSTPQKYWINSAFFRQIIIFSRHHRKKRSNMWRSIRNWRFERFYRGIELIHYLLRHFDINVLKWAYVCIMGAGVPKTSWTTFLISSPILTPKNQLPVLFLKHNTISQPQAHTTTTMTWTAQDTVFCVESFVNTVIFWS